MTREENIRAILECNLPIVQTKILDTIVKNIMALEQDTVPFDFELYQAGLMDMPKGIIEVLEDIKAEIQANRDEWIKGQDAEWHTYNRCLSIIEKHIGGEE